MTEEKLVETYAKLIWYIANRFYNVDKEDLFQTGRQALIEAYREYKKEKGVKFSSYAYMYIYGAMYKLASSRLLKVSRNIIKLKKDIEKASEILTQLNGWEPSYQEIAEFLNQKVDDIKTVMECFSPIISMDDEKEEARNLHESIADVTITNPDDHILLEESMQVLDPLEKEIITSRYYEDLTQMETATKLGINQVKVSRYESRSLNKMRQFINL